MTSLIFATSAGDQITQAVADVAEALRYPVLIAAMLALLVVAYELGRLGVEAFKRSQRPKTPFDQTVRQAFEQKAAGDAAGAQATLRSYAYGDALQKAAVGVMFAPTGIDAQRAMIEYDLYVSKRLDRVRLLVRAGPALGLMGTLIPLAPALAALGKGQPSVLADELQTAFAITVVGVLVGLVAFTVALVRERYYTRDLADLEFLRELRGDATEIAPPSLAQPSAAAPVHKSQADQPQAVATATAATVSMPAVASPAKKGDPKSPAASAPATPVTPSTPSAPTTPAPTAPPPAFPAPLATPEPKKKFGLKKKSKAADPPPLAFPPPPAPTSPPADQPLDKPESDKKDA